MKNNIYSPTLKNESPKYFSTIDAAYKWAKCIAREATPPSATGTVRGTVHDNHGVIVGHWEISE